MSLGTLKLNDRTLLFTVTLILLAFIWSHFNIYYYSHVHTDENGKIVVHAHPFQKNNPKTQAAPSHTHSRNEFIFLALIGYVHSLFTFLCLLFLFLLKDESNPQSVFSILWIPASLLYGEIRRRGPPVFVNAST